MIKPDRRILPAAQATLVDNSGRATPPFYDFMRRVIDATAVTPELLQQMRDLLAQFEALQAAIAALDLSKYTRRDVNEIINGEWTFRQAILGADGTVERPEYSFRDDNTSGLYRLGDNNVGFATEAAHRWDIDTTRVYQNVSQIIDNTGGLKVRVPTRTWCAIEMSNVDDVVDGNLTLGLWEVDGTHPTLSYHGFRFYMDGAPTAEAYMRFYRHDNSAIGNQVFYVTRTAAGIDFTEQVRALNGTLAAPSFSFTNDPNTGMILSAADALGFVTGAGERVTISTSSVVSTLPVRGPNGSVGSPTFSFSNDTNTGIYSSSGDVLGFSTAGSSRALLSGNWFALSVLVQGISGAATGPSYSFSGDPNTGMYSAGADILAFATSGTEHFRIGASGQFGLGGANYGTAGQIFTSNGSSAAPTWEDPAEAALQTFITVDDETGTLINSRQLVAGSNITIVTTTPGEIEISASGGGLGGDIAAEIMADSPTGYWKLDEASGNFADSSGNSNTLVANGTIRYRSMYLNRSDPTTLHAYFTSGAGAWIAGALGQTVPFTGDWTIEGIAYFPLATGSTGAIFGIGNTQVSANTNFQAMVYRSSATMAAFWEMGAGTNVQVNAPAATTWPEAHHFVVVKDGAANTVTFFVDGVQFGEPQTYLSTSEPTGGTDVNAGVGAIPGQTNNGCGLAHVAFYNGVKLSNARIAAHAAAAGY